MDKDECVIDSDFPGEEGSEGGEEVPHDELPEGDAATAAAAGCGGERGRGCCAGPDRGPHHPAGGQAAGEAEPGPAAPQPPAAPASSQPATLGPGHPQVRHRGHDGGQTVTSLNFILFNLIYIIIKNKNTLKAMNNIIIISAIRSMIILSSRI